MSSTIPNLGREVDEKKKISKLDKNQNTSNSATHILNDINQTILNNIELKQTNNNDNLESKIIESIQKSANNPKKRKRNRCYVCNVRVGLLGFECGCNRVFCSKHRLPENHECELDFKESGRKLIEKQNPKVVKDKVDNRL